MNSNDYLKDLNTRLENLKVRVQLATQDFDENQLNTKTPAHDWSLLGITHHLVVTMSAYWIPLDAATQSASPPASQTLQHTWFGKLLIKVAGPEGNAPAPAPLRPPIRQLDPSLISHLDAGLKRLQGYTVSLQDKDLVGTKMKNPFAKIVKMNLYDVLELHVQHTDRHVRQMEAVAEHLRRTAKS